MDEDTKRTLSAVWRGWKLDPDVFARYCQACGISPSSNPGVASASDPFLYPETLFLRHMIAIVTTTSFPVSPLGLIHLRQTVETQSYGAPSPRSCRETKLPLKNRGNQIDHLRQASLFQATLTRTLANTWTFPTTLACVMLRQQATTTPHHLYPRMARLLGYKQPMVHGMWTLAKVLAATQAG
eukprot:Em0776g4a